jgi:hypothetical protein
MTTFSSLKNISFALGCAALCLSAPTRADEQVPFKGSFNVHVVSVAPVGPDHLQLTIETDVLATHLGRGAGPASAILDLNDYSYVGEVTWSAANGDAIFITFAGQFRSTATLGVLENVETFEIVGGTGRFLGATGSGIAGGLVDATLTPLTPAPFTAMISSPGSLKR